MEGQQLHRPPREPDLFPLDTVVGLRRGEKTFVRREIYIFHSLSPEEFTLFYRRKFRGGGVPSDALMSIYEELRADFMGWIQAWDDYRREMTSGAHVPRRDKGL